AGRENRAGNGCGPEGRLKGVHRRRGEAAGWHLHGAEYLGRPRYRSAAMSICMKQVFALLLAGALVAPVTAVMAQQAQTQRVMGSITKVDGPTLSVKTPDGDVSVNLTDNAQVFGVVNATVADIK